MNMEEFRKGLESEAREENEKLKKEIKKLKEENLHLKTENKKSVDELKDYVRALSNRCYVNTSGLMCLHCNIPSNLCKYQFTEVEISKITAKVKKIDPYSEGGLDQLANLENELRSIRQKRLYKEKNVGKD